jgi:APA family basic amino acid/polyamine antiporter
MGELFGILAASCLSLEYIMAASAVSRSWADKVTLYLIDELHVGPWVHDYLQPNLWSVSPLAFLISTATVMLLLNGVHQTKAITNFFTVVKVGVVAFMIITGFALASPSNWIPFVPPQFGVVSVIRGSTVTFFGYLGYDEVCQLAGEAINPKRNLPIAILVTLVGVTVVYIAAALSLTGMQSYEDISSVSGFPVAFRTHGNLVAAQIAALGELLTLPVVVPLTIIGQPRLQYALAMDGLLPNWFGELDRHGNLYKGTVFCGIIFVALSTFVPFSNLNDMISAAVLTALNITDTSLILLWHQSPNEKPHLAENLLVMFHSACLVLSLLLMRYLHTPWGQALCLVSAITMLLCMLGVHQWCTRCDIFGGQQRRKHGVAVDRGSFRTPFVPFWPCIGIFINWYLFAQLDLTGILGMLGFLAFSTAYYFLHGIHHSIGNNGGWVAESEFPAEHTSLVQLGRLATRQPLQ